MLKSNNLGKILKRSISTTGASLARKPPKEEYSNNFFHTRKRTADPFDRRWRWTPKSAEPYNVRGGHIEWTNKPFLHRGVQIPGFIDPKTKEFIFVEEMVPEIVVPDLTDFQLKPYVPYNVKEIKNTVFGAKDLYKKTLEVEIIETVKEKIQKI
ncbi:39S ribosomal mitochondrial [Brachionus plicatilis]|uniref:39S ribosomal mitochondrial n=1 Tax=Brachionus plicatilis TaxID=10195 RepID=A0A3M7P286_BRAPC|nr:39S ribosomal mitochondrial [Brachionus plicatilis]